MAEILRAESAAAPAPILAREAAVSEENRGDEAGGGAQANDSEEDEDEVSEDLSRELQQRMGLDARSQRLDEKQRDDEEVEREEEEEEEEEGEDGETVDLFFSFSFACQLTKL